MVARSLKMAGRWRRRRSRRCRRRCGGRGVRARPWGGGGASPARGSRARRVRRRLIQYAARRLWQHSMVEHGDRNKHGYAYVLWPPAERPSCESGMQCYVKLRSEKSTGRAVVLNIVDEEAVVRFELGREKQVSFS
jgi:hypothetical protein